LHSATIVSGLDSNDRQRLTDNFTLGFRELQVRDLQRSDESGLRLGTFIQCAALIDALALSYSHGVESAGGEAGQWQRFIAEYFPPKYAPLAAADGGLRCLLANDASSAARTVGFTHDEPNRHLRTENDRLILDRGRFVAEVVRAFGAFERDLLYDDALAERVLAWLDLHPPLAFLAPAQATATPQAEPEVSPSEPVAASNAPQTDRVEAAAATRRPRAAPPRRAPSIKTRTKPKKRR
jgi:hypothetical protein